MMFSLLPAPQKSDLSWPGHRAESPAASGDTNAVSVLHNCFKNSSCHAPRCKDLTEPKEQPQPVFSILTVLHFICILSGIDKHSACKSLQ